MQNGPHLTVTLATKITIRTTRIGIPDFLLRFVVSNKKLDKTSRCSAVIVDTFRNHLRDFVEPLQTVLLSFLISPEKCL